MIGIEMNCRRRNRGVTKFYNGEQEKKAVKQEDWKQQLKYKWSLVDGIRKEQTRVRPPGLFRGRGDRAPKVRKACKADFSKRCYNKYRKGRPDSRMSNPW